ncbi:MAG: serine/threonine-protein phosphatase [Lachnospiraceae bacterium]|nr:serine/threonine-protein phosphatase [Lachnospiraceae bacterium]
MGLFGWLRKKEKQTQEGEGKSNDRSSISNTQAPEAEIPDAGSGEKGKKRLSYSVANLQGVGRRERQEDSFAFVNAIDTGRMEREGLYCIVSDGMGGMEGGKAASERAVSVLTEDFQGLDRKGDLPGSMLKSMQRANDEVFSMLKGKGGCTAAVCLLFEEKLYAMSVGDSFIFLLRDGKLCKVNREHNRMNELYMESIREGFPDPYRARQDIEAAALTHYIGMPVLDDVDLLRRPLKLKDGDKLLLCSDGVGGVIAEEELFRVLSELSPSAACMEMDFLIQGKRLPSQDNYTALVVQCSCTS